MARTFNLFISHSWSYSDQYDRLVRLLEQRPYFFFANYSVPPDDPIHDAPSSAALADAIYRQMYPCHLAIVLAGVYATYSTWINREIEIAKRWFATPKPVLGVAPWGQDRLSSVVQRSADLIVGWNADSIVEGIRTLSS